MFIQVILKKQNINDIPISEFPKAIKDLGLKPFNTAQIIQWIYKKGADSFDDMTNLSKEARGLLKERFCLGGLKLVKTLESKDGTKKFAWELRDGNVIESVLIPSESHEKASGHGQTKTPKENWKKRTTLCISTQVGCAMGCSFCRTGEMGFVRNLSQAEIIGQILEATRQEAGGRKQEKRDRGSCLMPHASHFNQRISNVVLMGMGEPLANYDNVLKALHIMLDTKRLGLSRRHVTLSTCGLVPEIERFARDNPGVKLAISLNATTDEQRERLMPIDKKYPLAKLFAALKKYSGATKRDVMTFEYVMVGDLNDSHEDAKRLVRLLSRFPSKVNLIPLNAACHSRESGNLVNEGDPHFRGDDRYLPPTEETVQQFAQYLRNKHIQVNIRLSRGHDILAACGQLASGETHRVCPRKSATEQPFYKRDRLV
ncbi:MAG: 23S rRNA (adenine(2503)-C(2))-methyltransferase RlmN [Deltaproteobacteria bacterium CG11_big_fil_rev_8_21_14_0_20_49_13]|nr:MAG: 23S rRNA (adenine(2503)-C(2))-methyltransferase RlmN [Deltaproteobacteria bacterium CG11_big_fil_rev_8_21_14_0_20_49_13]